MIFQRKYPSISGASFGLFFSGLAIVLLLGGATCTAVAGDLLRGGYTPNRSGSTVPGSFTPPSVVQARQNANDVLARTTKAILAVNAMESAARNLALSAGNSGITNPGNSSQTLPAVPNGLGVGGLYPTGGIAKVPTGWTGVSSLSQNQSGNNTTVTVVQNQPDAVLTWQTFNVGKSTTLDFNQNAGGADESKWIAFNIIQDPSLAPSQILGSIKAGGQVYVINQNGIIFGGASQINVHTLVASSLPIDTYLIGHGLLNNPDDQFLFSALAQPQGTNGSPAMAATSGPIGDVTVEQGAQITAPANADNVGGRVALIGANVTNDGSIFTPDGQTIMAAGLQVGLIPSTDANLRGLEAFVGGVSNAANPSAGLVTNDGYIYVPGGDAWITGRNVDQFGVIASTTTVTLNGRVDLLANYNSASSGGTVNENPFLPQATGAVDIGTGSVIDVLPAIASADTVVGTSLALSPEVNIQGKTIHMESNSTIFAPSASINVNAGIWDLVGETDDFVQSTGQIYLDSGAIIDAAGSADVSASVTQNIIPIQLLGPVLADSPSQRGTILQGQTIQVDIRDTGSYDGYSWVGTPLIDNGSAFAALIQYTVGELTINGGTVNLSAGGSVVMQPGSQVNVSGGWIDYQGGVVSTSEVISGGHVYPISQATPDLVYQGFNLGTFTVDHPKYGISATYTDPILDVSHYENSYVSGGNGGTVSIVSPSVALDGQLVGVTVDGPRQRSVLSTPNTLATSSFPTPSALSLAFEQEQLSSLIETSPTPPQVIFSQDTSLPAVGAFAVNGSGVPNALPTSRQDEVILSPDLFTADGFGSLKINDSDGNVTLPASVSLDPGPDGSISISAANLDIEGSITAPGGALSFTAYDFSPFIKPSQQPPINPARGHFILGPAASLSTAGLVVDDRNHSPGAGESPLMTSGGSVVIHSLNVDLSAGSEIDVSGGVELNSSGKPLYGAGGSINISAGQDPGIGVLLGGALTLDADLMGFSGAKGGSLSLSAYLVQIGGAASHPDTLLLSPDFFSQGGFSSYSLTGIGAATSTLYDFIPGLVIAPGTVIDPVATSLVAVAGSPGAPIQLVPAVLPVGVRPPVNLSFKASGASTGFTGLYDSTLLVRGDLVMGAGSEIETDPGASVSLKGQTVAVFGSIVAPAGAITISGALDSTTLFGGGVEPTVDLGSQALLSTAGVTVLTANAYGYRTGSVLNGGSITVSGNIVAEAGSVLDVSGASGILDLTPVQANLSATPGGATDAVQPGSFAGMVLVPTVVDSNGGSITLKGSEELFTDATLIGAAGGPSAIGGSLTVSSGRGISSLPATYTTLTVTQGGPGAPSSFVSSGQDVIGHLVVNSAGNPVIPMGYMTVDAFASGGFDAVTLAGTVQFSGPVNISLPGSITVATGGVLYANAPVHLSADSVTLGLAFIPPTPAIDQQPPFGAGASALNFSPTYGPGSLTVTANDINIGALSLQGIGSANFIANGGDIQGDGTLDVQGRIYMQAGQVYVPTETIFTIAAYDYSLNGKNQAGTIQFAASGQRDLPLSAGGDLNVYATDIVQDGVLRAPLGSINLGWNGSGTAPIDPITGAAVPVTQNLTLGKGSITSVSAVDPLTGQGIVIPYGANPNGNAWIDPSGVDITSGGVPQKSIAISAVNVNDQKGAVIDIRGGGDLLAAQFVSGVGGMVDILASTASFAIMPGYQATYAPYDTDSGYNNSSLAPGDQIYLNGSTGLPAGVYTLLPARYALLPGAFLVTPQSSLPVGASQILPDGGSLVSGYRFGAGQSAASLTTSFEVDSSAILGKLATYTVYSGNTFLAQGATLNNQKIPRLPQDSGELSFQALSSLAIAGSVESIPLLNGLGGLVDISSPDNILITGASSSSAPPNTLVLNATELDSFGAASLFIGGIRQTGINGVTLDVGTANITVNNAGDPLTGSDIILAAIDTLTIDPNAEIEASGAASGATAITVSGNGVLLRVSSDPTAPVTRTGVTTATQPELAIGSGSKITGVSVTLDSSAGTSLDPKAVLQGKSVALNSGQITLELTNPGTVAPTTGLILSGNALSTLFASAQSVSFLSYSSLDIYGTGQIGAIGKNGQPVLQNLTLSAGEIRGFNSAAGSVTFASQNILLENIASASDPGAVAASGGTLNLDGNIIALGANSLAIDQFTAVDMNAAVGMVANASTGSLTANGALNLTTPLITAAAGASENVTASGALAIATPSGTPPASVKAPVGGFGANLTFVGSSITDNSVISAQSGSVTLHASTGDLAIGNLASASIDVSGQSRAFFDVTKYTNAGEVNLIADQGNVIVGKNTSITVAAQSGGGNAGMLSITDPNGTLTLGGKLAAQGGAGGNSGSFSLDVGSLSTLSALDATLNAGDFDQSRTIDVRTGDVMVDGLATAANFSLSADAGSITVSGEIDGSGQTGGVITLQAAGSVTLLSSAVLTVAAQKFSDAQKGGSIDLEAGSDVNGAASATAVVDIQAGSTIDLSVAATPAAGDLAGTLLLRAPMTAGNTDLQVNPINGTITGASSITVEGYQIYNTASDGGSIDDQEGNVYNDGSTFAGNSQAISSRLLANNSGLASLLLVEPGAEIINPSGDLTLANSWDLSPYRFGPNSLPGDLTLRAAGNLVFEFGASLSDGFDPTQSPDGFLWDAPLLSTVGAPSYSYRLVAGADFSRANFAALTPLADLPAGSGSLLLGEGARALPASVSAGFNVPEVYFQTIRTGAGSIQIDAGRDVQLLNNLATIYTAGAQAPALSVFQTPDTSYPGSYLGKSPLNPYPAQFTEYGGSVSIEAQNDITHLTLNKFGQIVPDSSLEMPDNWLDRQGAIDPTTGQFIANGDSGVIESTAWWIDFSNFFEGVATFGGGDVTLKAGNNITNVDAAVATNAAMNSLTPDASAMVELGGGDLHLTAGANINGGVYYVERGLGVIDAGGQILTNATRAAITQRQASQNQSTNQTPDPSTWLPTTLFAGDASFDVTAGGNILLGPVANPFLLPQSIYNSFANRSFFSTYAPTTSIAIESLAGDVTIRDSSDSGSGSLATWIDSIDSQYGNDASYAAVSQTWLAIAQSNVALFDTVAELMPPTLRVTAFSGSINLVGSIILSPASNGTLDLFAAQSVNGTQVNGIDGNVLQIGSSLIDLSDAAPASIPSITSPVFGDILPLQVVNPFIQLDTSFTETGSVVGSAASIQSKEALHDPGLLHAGDSTPLRIYASTGDLSGVTLFSAKFSKIVVGQDITDAAFYIQNVSASDVSVVSAGRDIVPYDPISPLRLADQNAGDEFYGGSAGANATSFTLSGYGTGAPTTGDIQISGPGAIEVLAGRNFTAGIGSENPDGTSVGITSIGNGRNPYLPFNGAQVILDAGLGGVADGLSSSSLDWQSFDSTVLGGADASTYFSDLAATENFNVPDYSSFQKLSKQQQAIVGLDLFYLVLRDSGRDHNLLGSPGYGNYSAALAAIQALIPSAASSATGDIDLTSKEIKTESGGDINIFDPAGQLTVGIELGGAQPVDQGILTEDGGNVSIYTQGSVNLGTSRIFTLHGGNIIIWSNGGDIAAGEAAKTVQSAPPTRVLIDPQSADVETDLAGLATGGGIGVLASVQGVAPGNVDLIAPAGIINAGDAGIRATGNVSLAAVQILNASNIQAGGATTGVPTVTVSAPNLGALSAASSAAGASSAAANEQTANNTNQSSSDQNQADSIITVTVVGYGGGDTDDSM
jgi:filamentous hemagglutinin family protein